MRVNSTPAPFHQVDMLSYLKDENPCAQSLLRVMDEYCSSRLYEGGSQLPHLAEDELLGCYLDDMYTLGHIKDMSWAFAEGGESPYKYPSFLLPMWFLVDLLKYMCVNRHPHGCDICFVIDLIRQCK